ncbi:hypothetical protein [Gilliamella sp. Occ3-1]|uniref:hypothetical protein n=1 Tax=unclassified Gilliamella TaxID=2685620 RepID=UPI00080DE5CA|nr:hypothetical protein [Gilliamella apicola]OCG69516.1 hypothetical protein A9G43_00930 [Gilliamella apicola]
MKTKKSVRLDNDLINAVNNYATLNGMNFSQVIEKTIKDKFQFNEQTADTNVESSVKNRTKNVRFDERTLKEVSRIASKKNITVTEEIRFRVSSSLSMPCFDSLELKELEQTRINVNQIGRLINMSIREKLIINNTHIIELIKLINEMNNALVNIIKESQERLF